MESEGIKLLWSIISVGLIWPMAEWLKSHLPGDFPVKTVFIVSILAIFTAWGIAKIFYPAATMDEIIMMALTSQVMSQYFNETKKSFITGG